MSCASADLLAAYRRTHYRVDTPQGTFAIHIDQPCPPLDALLARHGCREWAYITAYNPRSAPLSPDMNAARQAELLTEVQAQGWIHYHGQGQPAAEDAGWTAEDSLLIVGMDAANAARLGRRFGQNAVVVGQMGEAARLWWL